MLDGDSTLTPKTVNSIVNHKYKILLIIPCFNEQSNILKLHTEVSTHGLDAVFVNDASLDSSLSILKENKIPHLDLLLNLGIGGAMQTGYRYAIRYGYDIAVQVDGDGQHDLACISKLIEPIILGQADMVIGSRFIEKIGFQSSAPRRVGIIVFKILFLVLMRTLITDATSGFRAMNARTLELFNNYYAKDFPEPESTMHALRNGLRVIEVPTVMRERQGGTSSITPWKSVYYMIKVSLAILISAIQPRQVVNRK